MTKPKHGFPKFCRHVSGAAFVKLSGEQIWLGKFDDPASRQKYDRLIAEWLANGRQIPSEELDLVPSLLSIAELVDKYRVHVEARYSPGEAHAIRAAARICRELYGDTPAAEFGPIRLRAVRAVMITGDTAKKRRGWTRNVANNATRKLRAMFRWGVSHELVPEATWRRLCSLQALQPGEAMERPKVTVVGMRDVRRARHGLSVPVRAIVNLQLLTAARCDEIVRLRAVDLDTSGEVWKAVLKHHKTAHKQKRRTIYFGPKAQRILRLFMTPGRPVDAYLFSPREADAAAKRLRGGVGRREGQKATPRKTDRVIGDRYTTSSVCRAIHRSCARRGLTKWSPHRLRHNAATFIAKEFGIELAGIICGHASLNQTEIYAERDDKRAIQVIQKIG